MILAPMRVPVQCVCGAFTILDPIEQEIDECEDCEVLHVAVMARGTCRRCGDVLGAVWRLNVSVEAVYEPDE